ncbi:MAG: hypothetical protein FJ148_09250 [Deltaproteobacteria bacterium]|nr:hypothetical protein [Deltaproteobacteria bacterium]
MPSADDPDDEPAAGGRPPPTEPFYRGTLIRLSRAGGRGVVRSLQTGREIPFEREHTMMPVPRDGSDWFELREGMIVGYDVGWTSRGLRVTKLFPVPPVLTAEVPSET